MLPGPGVLDFRAMKALWNVLRAGSGRVGTESDPAPGGSVAGAPWAAHRDPAPEAEATIRDPQPRVPAAAPELPAVPPEPVEGPDAPGRITLDRDWNIRFINAAAAGVFGYTAAELLGQGVQTLIPHSLAAQTEPAGPGREGERDEWVIGRSKDGRRFPLRFVAREPGSGADREVTLILQRSHELESAAELVPVVAPRLGELERQVQELTETREAALASLAGLRAEHERLQAALQAATSAPVATPSPVGNGHPLAPGVDPAPALASAPELDRVRRRADVAEARGIELESRLQEVAALVHSLEQALAARDAADAARALADQERETLRARIESDRATAETRLREAVVRLEAMREEAEDAYRTVAATRTELDIREAELAAARANLADVRAQAAALGETVAGLEDQLRAARADAEAAREQAGRLAVERDADRQQAVRLTGERDADRQQAARLEHEAMALRGAIDDVSRELGAARVVLASLQHERDGWQAREAQARNECGTLAATLAQREREGEELRAQLQAREEECGRLQQREAEGRRSLQALEAQLAEHQQALAANRRDAEARDEQCRRLQDDLQDQVQARTRAEHESRALTDTTSAISRELAAARVIVETLRQERDLWQEQAGAARAEVETAREVAAAAEERERQLGEATEGICVSLRQTLGLAASEMVSRVTELHATLARRQEAEAREASARAEAEAALARSQVLEDELRQQLAAPLGRALEGLCRALADTAAARPAGVPTVLPAPEAEAPVSSTPAATA